MKWFILNCMSSILFRTKIGLGFNATKPVEIVIYQFEYKYNGNEVADIKIKRLIKWNDRTLIDHVVQVLKISKKSIAKFLPNYIIEITQEGKIVFSILTSQKYFKCGGITYKSMMDIDKHIYRLINKV